MLLKGRCRVPWRSIRNNLSRSLALAVLREVMEEANYVAWPLRDETLSVVVTRDEFSKTISTRRYSENVSKLEKHLDARLDSRPPA